MDSIRKIYKIGFGPSSSHSMGPQYIMENICSRYPNANFYEISLYSSLAATGKGHFTDKAIERVLQNTPFEIHWHPETELPGHPNGMKIKIFRDGKLLDEEIWYSIGGGEISRDGKLEKHSIYPHHRMDEILRHCEKYGISLWEYVFEIEGNEIADYLREVWKVMKEALERGLNTEGVLPGGLGLQRKALMYHQKAKMSGDYLRNRTYLAAYALAVAEENAVGNRVVTAPTCGSAGVLPAVLYFLERMEQIPEERIIRALATAGLIGNLVKHNASISGAEVGCQGEIGTACSMAAGAAVQLLAGSPSQIEYAAEMGLEHFLGLTCDPVKGMVQIPCI
ncbi:MAG: serine dehydratase, partial [Methanobacteriota archaeon]